MLRVTAVVLNYRNWEGTAAVVRALDAQTSPPRSVVVVDNASEQTTEPMSAPPEGPEAHWPPEVRILRQSANGGYAAGMNAGIEVALQEGADAVLLLTHDCLLEPDCLAQLAAALQEPGTGVAAPVLGWRSRPELAWAVGGGIGRWSGMPFQHRKGELLTRVTGTGTREVDWSDGACLLISRACLAATGRVPEEYFLYFEEVDLQERARRAGFSVRVVLGALAWQDPGGTPVYLATRNQVLWLRRFRPASLPLGLLRTGGMVAKELVRVGLRRTTPARPRAMALGVLDGLAGGRRLRRELLGVL